MAIRIILALAIISAATLTPSSPAQAAPATPATPTAKKSPPASRADKPAPRHPAAASTESATLEPRFIDDAPLPLAIDPSLVIEESLPLSIDTRFNSLRNYKPQAQPGTAASSAPGTSSAAEAPPAAVEAVVAPAPETARLPAATETQPQPPGLAAVPPTEASPTPAPAPRPPAPTETPATPLLTITPVPETPAPAPLYTPPPWLAKRAEWQDGPAAPPAWVPPPPLLPPPTQAERDADEAEAGNTAQRKASTAPRLAMPDADYPPLPVVELSNVASPAKTIDLTAPPQHLWERLRNGYAMPNLSGPLVLHHQQWYLNRPEYLQRMIERSKRYLHHIVEALEKRGMPTELALLPMVESAYNPMAYSPAHASGLWQFIPSTGKNFKLRQDWWIDERRDIVASTTAALDYLQTIYDMHGDWFLALASYNWGEGAVSRAIKKNEAKGLPTGYVDLTMPAETRNYIPKLQALKNIFSNPQTRHQLKLPDIPDRPYFAAVENSQPIDIKIAAKLAEMPVEEFVALNPAHNRPLITPAASLILPRDKINTFMANREEHRNADKRLASWQPYTLKAGDRLEKIAPKFGISLSRLKEINGLNGRIKIIPGATLLVPSHGDDDEIQTFAAAPLRLPSADPPPPANSDTQHLVKRGEQLETIAKKYRLSVAELKRLNPQSGKVLRPGTRLRIANTPVSAQAPAPKPAARGRTEKPAASQAASTKGKAAQYTIRPGDTLYSIARRFKVDTEDLQRWNRLNGSRLRPGQTLTIQLAQQP